MQKSVFIPLILALILFCGCDKEKMPVAPPYNPPVVMPPVTPPTTSTGVKKYLALGDSYTIGQSVDIKDRFPMQTQALLIASGYTNLSAPDIIAATGWTTVTLQSAIESTTALKNDYDVVSLLIGVNDQYQRRDTTGYRQNFTKNLTTAIYHAGGKPTHVFVLSIPDYGVTPFGKRDNPEQIRQQIDWFNAINYEVTQQKGCTYINITPSTREAAYDLSLVASDGLHPSGKEYLKWATMLAPAMKTVLQ